MRKRLFDIIQIGNKDDFPSRSFDIFLVVVITLNILVMFLETFNELARFYGLFRTIEISTIVLFCIEYLLRIWTADYLYPQLTKARARLKFLTSFDGVVDLLTILPFFFLTGFVAFRMLRVVRIFHLFRLNAQYDSFNVITYVLYEKRNQIISSVFIIIILMLCSSLCMYSAEHEAQPDVFENAFSGIWWSVSTVLTVGYGDIYPITIIGKCMAIVIAFLGVMCVAIPTGIISAGFVEKYQADLRPSAVKKIDINDIVEMIVDDSLANRTISDVKSSEKMNIYTLLRGEISILPNDDVYLNKGDIIIAKMLDK